ncbi:SMI1/KNR4 family protein [Listeria kieliensis]|uniref:SMI1/KNR4 family protein n=1 Tax=Listeria kieliensis TaxID=1621700 RepID=UPI001058487B|nr:SMI1/KNR4 family protein [Listeria kieliensis]
MKTPDSIKRFYEKVHNGFYYFPSQAMGLLPTSKIYKMSEDDWGILDFLESPIKIHLETSFPFFSTGMGGYVVLDYQNPVEENAAIWFVDDQPEHSNNF